MMFTVAVSFRRMAFDRAFSRYPASSRVELLSRSEARAEAIPITPKVDTIAIKQTVINT